MARTSASRIELPSPFSSHDKSTLNARYVIPCHPLGPLLAIRRIYALANCKGGLNRAGKSLGAKNAPPHGKDFVAYDLAQITPYNFRLRKRRAFAITDTELKLMAADARIGLSRIPKNG